MAPEAPARIRIAAMGDIMLDRKVGRHFFERPQDFRCAAIAERLADYDIVFANLENPVGISGTPHPIQKANVTFCCHPDTLTVLDNLGVNAVSLGNNHMLDHGDAALAETLANLDMRQIGHAGAGRDYEEANRPLRMTINGVEVALLSYVFLYSASTRRAGADTAGVSDHRIRNILARIRRLRAENCVVLVSVHWGAEYRFFPLPYQMRQARRMIDCGASLIIGHGPHYAQGIERYQHGEIIYSLGDFIFDEPHKYSRRTFIYAGEVSAQGAVLEGRIYPCTIRGNVPSLAEGRDGERIERQIRHLGSVYPTRPAAFWRRVNAAYLTDIIWRVKTMQSFKFVFLPPLRFYWEVGLRGYLRKLNWASFCAFTTSLTQRFSRSRA